MRRIKTTLVLFIMLIILSCFVTGCSVKDMKYGNGNVESSKTNYMLERITDVPDGWKTSKYMCFYYDINTYIIYVGKNDLVGNNGLLYELKSKDYRNYVYDKDNNEFVGIK